MRKLTVTQYRLFEGRQASAVVQEVNEWIKQYLRNRHTYYSPWVASWHLERNEAGEFVFTAIVTYSEEMEFEDVQT